MSPHLNASTEKAPESHLERDRWPEGQSGTGQSPWGARTGQMTQLDSKSCLQSVALFLSQSLEPRPRHVALEVSGTSTTCPDSDPGKHSVCPGPCAHLPRAPAPTRSPPATTRTPCCLPCRWPGGAAVGPTGRHAQGTAARAPRTVSASVCPRSRRRSGRCLRTEDVDRHTGHPPAPGSDTDT